MKKTFTIRVDIDTNQTSKSRGICKINRSRLHKILGFPDFTIEIRKPLFSSQFVFSDPLSVAAVVSHELGHAVGYALKLPGATNDPTVNLAAPDAPTATMMSESEAWEIAKSVFNHTRRWALGRYAQAYKPNETVNLTYPVWQFDPGKELE